MDIVASVELALGLEDKAVQLMEEVSSFFEKGDVDRGMVILSRLFKEGPMLLQSENITPEFRDFLEDEGMKEWIETVGISDPFSEPDALEIIIPEVLLLVNNKKLLKNQQLEVEEVGFENAG